MDSNGGHQDSIRAWQMLIGACFSRRLGPKSTIDAIKVLYARKPINGVSLAELVLQAPPQTDHNVDPLVSAYLRAFLDNSLVDTADILKALLNSSQFSTQDSNAESDRRISLITLESVANLLSNLYGLEEHKRPRTLAESRKAYHALGEWLKACHAYETMLQVDSVSLDTINNAVVSAFEAIGTFAILMLSNNSVKAHMKKYTLRGESISFSTSLNQFASFLSQWSQSGLAARIQSLARNMLLVASSTDGQIDFDGAEISSAITDLPKSLSRAGMYAYINAVLCERRAFDNSAIFNYLRARYPSDPQTMMVQLIGASFDCLVNHLRRDENMPDVLSARSFLANKLPLLLQMFSTSLFPPMTIEHCIQMAMAQVEVSPVPPLTKDRNGINDKLKQSKRDFIYACHLHQLITDATIAASLGEATSTKSPKLSRYNKDQLVSQCTNNVNKIEDLYGELDRMQGNAGAITAAIVEVMQHFSESKETMSLKTVSLILVRKIHLIDIMVQYIGLSQLLSSLCRTLNDWPADEESSELQPAYEEFSAILLLVMAIVHRYEVLPMDPSLGVSDAFVSKLLINISESISPNNLTDDQSNQFTKWVKGLYATDDKGETSGISDETMSGCPPQAFYLLVPTLFDQSIEACRTSRLEIKVLKGGLEFLLEPFLLPSVVAGLHWITRHNHETIKDAEILYQIVDKLIRPSSLSGDAQSMHKAIMIIMAAPLVQFFTDNDHRLPNKKAFKDLKEELQVLADNSRFSKSTIHELSEWMKPVNDLRHAVSALVVDLSVWAARSDMGTIPVSYSHRCIVAALDIMGADKTLMTLADAVQTQTAIGLGPNALECATAIICAPSSDDIPVSSSISSSRTRAGQNRLTLRQALKLRLDNTKALLDLEVERVETLVRLGRLVDAQSITSNVSQVSLPMTQIGTDDIMQDMDMSNNEMIGTQAALDHTNTVKDSSVADFNTALNQPVDMPDAGSATMVADSNPSAMNIDLSNNIFEGDQNMDFNLNSANPMQSQQDAIANATASTEDGRAMPPQTSMEDDIFAGIDFADINGLDDDFNF